MRPARAVVRQTDSGGRRFGRDVPRATRRGGGDRAVELPDDDRVVGFRPALAAGNAVLVKPAEITPLTTMRLGELALQAGLPDGLFQVLPGKGSVVGAVHQPPGRPQDRLHRFHRDRGARDGRRRQGHQAGHPGTRRQERQYRLRRLRPGEGRRHHHPTASSTTPARTAVRAAGSWCSAASSTGSWSCWSRRSGVVVGDPAGATARWDRWCRAALRVGGRLRARRRAGGLSGLGAQRARFWFPPTVLLGAHRSHRHRGDLRPGGHGAGLRGRGRRHRVGQRQRIRSVRVDFGPTTCPARCGSPAPSSRATSASTHTPRCVTTRRSAGSSNPGWAANSDRTRRNISPKPRTSSSRSELPNDPTTVDLTQRLAERSPSSPVGPAVSGWPRPADARRGCHDRHR